MNFENRAVFDAVMSRLCWLTFFGPPCTMCTTHFHDNSRPYSSSCLIANNVKHLTKFLHLNELLFIGLLKRNATSFYTILGQKSFVTLSCSAVQLYCISSCFYTNKETMIRHRVCVNVSGGDWKCRSRNTGMVMQ